MSYDYCDYFKLWHWTNGGYTGSWSSWSPSNSIVGSLCTYNTCGICTYSQLPSTPWSCDCHFQPSLPASPESQRGSWQARSLFAGVSLPYVCTLLQALCTHNAGHCALPHTFINLPQPILCLLHTLLNSCSGPLWTPSIPLSPGSRLLTVCRPGTCNFLLFSQLTIACGKQAGRKFPHLTTMGFSSRRQPALQRLPSLSNGVALYNHMA